MNKMFFWELVKFKRVLGFGVAYSVFSTQYALDLIPLCVRTTCDRHLKIQVEIFDNSEMFGNVFLETCF